MAVKKFISWNVNGIRACIGKGFEDAFNALDADIFCLQEIKLQQGQLALELRGYYQFWNYAKKKGYSGTAVFTKERPVDFSYDLGIEELDGEGRVITLEFVNYYIVTVYSPNAQEGLKRIDFRMKWEDAFRNHVLQLDKKKPVVICGDMNVAHNKIDLKNPSSNRGNAGFSDEERAKFNELLKEGFTDSFRFFYPKLESAYSWWSYRFNARERNAGWRIDYFLVSDRLKSCLKDAKIHADIYGSDHCPVEVEIEF
ncbi:MAG: exodeoxyribonuclease III [Clostridiales bacterium]|jgi:exodeoxyribonuclease-3|nr:exodeoxyribonuclease III [Clostridiales bacterium]